MEKLGERKKRGKKKSSSSDVQDDTSTTSRESINSSNSNSNVSLPGIAAASSTGAGAAARPSVHSMPVDSSSSTSSRQAQNLPMSDKRALFQEKVRQSNEACQNADFPRAIRLYTEALDLDPANHILYSNRSAAHVKLKDYERALTDAIKARELNPKWAKAYYRQGVALQCLGRHADALAAFASGLAQDPKSLQLLAGLVEAAMKSPLKDNFEPTYKQLVSMNLDKSPFVIISVIGQELLAAGYHASSLVVLESALKIGTSSLKLRGSVFSALSSAHWGLGNTEKAISFMHQDLSVAKSLSDHVGECRAHGNLGAAYFSQRNYKEALTHHHFQLYLAMKQKDRNVAASALSSLGHVYSAIGDFPNALTTHKQCVTLARQLNDKQFEAREIGNVGAVQLALGDFDKALECHKQHLEIAKQLENRTEEARAYSNLGSAFHYRRNFDKASHYHTEVLGIAKLQENRAMEARAYAGLGHAARCSGDLNSAKQCHEQQLNIALSTKDKLVEAQACSNLGIVYQQQGQYETALKLHKAHLNIAMEMNDRGAMGRAYGNMGNAYSALNQHEQAIKYHKQELTISREVNDRGAEACTHGNLAVAYQAMNMKEKAMEHYQGHLAIAAELRDKASEARALSNLGNYHSSRGEFQQAIPFYERYLALAKEVKDLEGQGKGYHNLGYAHYSLGNYKSAVQFYEKDLLLARDQKDKVWMGRAYCNLGLAYRTLGNFERAEDCQKCFLTIAQQVKNAPGKFRALGNLGDIYMAKKDIEGAVRFYEQQLQLAKQVSNKALEATAYGALGATQRKLKHYDKALAHHTQELQLYQELNDIQGECKAHSHLGAVHTALGKFLDAFKCYEEQLARAREVNDGPIQAQAHGNLGITKMNMNLFEDALGYFEEQLAALEQVGGNVALQNRASAFRNLAECYEALGDMEEAVKYYEQYLFMAQRTNSAEEQDKAYHGLGNVHRSLGNLQQASFYYEKRLVLAHETNSSTAKASAYGELGCLHSLMGNFEQAISCLENQLRITLETNDKAGQADAACGLGGVYQQMGEYEKALEFHEDDLKIAEETNNLSCQGRAFGNLGVTQESLGNYQKAIMYQEQHLSIAAQVNDRVAKTLAYASLGRVHHALRNFSQSVTYFKQGLQIANQLGRKEDEAKIRHRLGLALWSNNKLDDAQHELYRATELFEHIRRESQGSGEYKLSLFDAQSASYQALQRVLVALERTDEALAVAERGRTRAFVDLLLERQSGEAAVGDHFDASLMTNDVIQELVSRQSANILYFSIADGHLYSWLMTPGDGIVKFHDCDLAHIDKDPTSDDQSSTASSNTSLPSLNLSMASGTGVSYASTALLEQYISHAREALGVDSHHHYSSGDITSETESEADELLQQHLEELSAKLDPDRSSFLRLTNRNHIINSSARSVASLASQLSGVGSLNGSLARREAASRILRQKSWSGKPPLRALYDVLISPLEDAMPQPNGPDTPRSDLVLVLEGDLYLVPFAILKGGSSTESLHERFNIRMVPSLRALNLNLYWEQRTPSSSGMQPALVVANPKLPPSVVGKWGWNGMAGSEQEATAVSELLSVKPLTGAAASKEGVLRLVESAECLHFATHVSWKLSALVLSPKDVGGRSTSPIHLISGNNQNSPEQLDLNDMNNPEDSSMDGPRPDIPSLSDFLLTAADVLDLRLTAKLVVLSPYGNEGRGGGRITSDSVIGLARSFLAAGAQSVLVPLWSMPESAVQVFMRALYDRLLGGSKASAAVTAAMKSVREVKQFSHPSNWAGFALVGCDARLSNKSAMFGNALGDILTTPSKCRDALRVLLHLIEKSLQRINRGQTNPMYTTQQSITKRVGPVRGWQELLKSVGFRFEEEISPTIPPSVFFPQSDPGDRLLQASASLQALLGLSNQTNLAISKLLPSPEAALEIIEMLQHVQSKYSRDREGGIQLPVQAKLWRTPGCHELLASLGFDLIDVGREEVLLITSKQVSRKVIHYTLQGLLAIFNPTEAPKTLPLESFSSMESLNSETSGTSMSGMSGFSLSAMSGTSIISSHSLKAGEAVPPQSKISRSIVRSVKEGRRNHLQSTPKNHIWRGSSDYQNSSMNSLSLNNPALSPVSPSPPSTPDPALQKQVNGTEHKKSTSNHPGIPEEVLAFLQDENAFSPDSVPPPMRLASDSPVSLGSQRSSRESLIGGTNSPVVGTVNPAFIDETDDIVSERGYTLAALKRLSPTVRGISPTGKGKIGSNRPSRSPSPGDVFLPSAAVNALGQTSRNSSRGNSPAGKPVISGKTRRQNSTDSVDSSKGARQKNRTSPLQTLGHEAIAMRVLRDTMKHMTAVERMQQYSDLQHNREKLRRNSSQDRSSPLDQDSKVVTGSNSSSNNSSSVPEQGRNVASTHRPVSATVVESRIHHHTANAETKSAPMSSMVGTLEKAERRPPPPIKAKPPRAFFEQKLQGSSVNTQYPRPYVQANGGVPSRTNGYGPVGLGPDRPGTKGVLLQSNLAPSLNRTNNNNQRMSGGSESSDGSSTYPRSSVSSDPDRGDSQRETPPYNHPYHNQPTLPHTKPFNNSPPPDYKQIMLSRQRSLTDNTPSPNSSLDTSSQARASPLTSQANQYMNRRPGSALSTNSSLYSSTSSIQSVIHVPSAASAVQNPRQITKVRQGSLDSTTSSDSLGLVNSPRTPLTPNRPMVNGGIKTPISSPRDSTIVTKDGERKVVGQRVYQSSPC
ncbi:tetratricopeptide repeat protein 28-like [Diadema antillarum]|uniref:tetratricopeptide repeat protein 28-like n=1 Tax=Diadema antillarum TaxID=105358 RepID=UPI003A8499AD